jgi:uncharacterized membrane protein YdjX (TVP38/TMEM64 family)
MVQAPSQRPHHKSRTLISGRQLVAMAFIISAAVLYVALSREIVSFESVIKYGNMVQAFVADNYLLAVISYFSAYTVAILILMPGALWFATLGGLMFGLLIGTVYASIVATIGSAVVFILARHVFDQWLHPRVGHFLDKMRKGFREGAFSYLLAIRLMPLFPFVAVNVAPAALDVSFKTYVLATFIGTLPWTMMHVLVGVGLRDALRTGDVVSPMEILLRPKVLAGLAGLTLLALVPIAYRRLKSHNKISPSRDSR